MAEFDELRKTIIKELSESILKWRAGVDSGAYFFGRVESRLLANVFVMKPLNRFFYMAFAIVLGSRRSCGHVCRKVRHPHFGEKNGLGVCMDLTWIRIGQCIPLLRVFAHFGTQFR